MQDKLNKIIQADCLEYLKSLPDGCVQCVLIDEPYMLLKGHKIEEGYNLDIAKQVRIEAMRVLKKDGWFIFFGAFPSAWDFGRITMEAGFKPWQMCNEFVWCKTRSAGFLQKVERLHENIFVFKKGKPQIYENKAPYEDVKIPMTLFGLNDEKQIYKYVKDIKQGNFGKTIRGKKSFSRDTAMKINDKIYQNIYEYKVPNIKKFNSVWAFGLNNGATIDGLHVSAKPVLLLRRLIKLFTQQCDTILDCFAGSGTTALASIQEGRNFLCCERDEGYVKIANDRLENWQEDLLRQDKWLNERGVTDFESDIKHKVKMETLL